MIDLIRFFSRPEVERITGQAILLATLGIAATNAIRSMGDRRVQHRPAFIGSTTG
jgi:hypothetical protein